MYITEPLV